MLLFFSDTVYVHTHSLISLTSFHLFPQYYKAIATFGGHKGMGLSLCVEMLAGALSGGAVLGQVESKKEARSWGHTFVAIRPEDLVDSFDEKAASIIATVKQSGVNVRIPGERSAVMAQEQRETGTMPIPEKIWESIVHTSKYGLSK
jgi:LDH2 family malate/lactate/ureidoglycolate dehydrogenase